MLPVLALFAYGAIAGSFVGALVYRLRKGQNISQGRSKCESCSKALGIVDLIPIVGWLVNRGKCRFCNKKIDKLYPLFELTSGLIFVANWLVWPLELSSPLDLTFFIFWMLMVTNLLAISLYDFLYQEIPDQLQKVNLALGLIVFGLGYYLDYLPAGNWLNALLGVAGLFGSFWALHYFSEGKWLGGADVILVAPFGLLLGLPLGLVSISLASYLALAAILLAYVFARKHKFYKKIPFGPFLSAGFVICFLAATEIEDLFNRLVGL